MYRVAILDPIKIRKRTLLNQDQASGISFSTISGQVDPVCYVKYCRVKAHNPEIQSKRNRLATYFHSSLSSISAALQPYNRLQDRGGAFPRATKFKFNELASWSKNQGHKCVPWTQQLQSSLPIRRFWYFEEVKSPKISALAVCGALVDKSSDYLSSD